MSTTIESLELEVLSSSQSAESGLDALTASLEKLKKATSGGVGLTSVIKQIKGLGDVAKSIDSNSINNLNGITKAIGILSNLGGVKLSSTIATQITAIGDSAKTLNGVNFAPISDLANSLQPLASIGKINLTSVVNQLKQVPEMITQLNGVDISGFATKVRELVTALQPLSEMPKQTISSTLTQIKKIPEIFDGLNGVDMGAFSVKIQELATALKPLADEMNKVAAGFSAFPAKIQRLIANTNSLAASNNKASTSYVNLYAKLKMAITAVKNIASKIASAITTMNDCIENVNLFTASMGQYANDAQDYAEKVGELMGIDPSEWMRNQGVFMTLATGFGVAGDRAYTMSQQLTQLGYDLSSFFNISYEDAMQKLQSGLSGELEPLRRLGYDLSQAKLQTVALSLGIDKSVSSMTQAEKAQLRYYAIMTQVTTAQGDMGRTLNAPANQLRVFKAQVTQAARAIGSIFIPALNAILPYAIAVAQIIRYIVNSIASLFGFEIPEVDYSGIDSVIGSADDANEALDNAADSAENFKNQVLGIDELNRLGSQNTTSGNGIDANIGSGFDFDLPTYDFISSATESRVAKIIKEMKEWLGLTGEINSWADFFNTRLGQILSTVGLIGAGIATWKLSTGLIKGLSYLSEFKGKEFSWGFSILGVSLFLADLDRFRGYIEDVNENGFDFENVTGALSEFAGLMGDCLLMLGQLKWAGALKAVQGIGEIVSGISDISKNGANIENVTTIVTGLSNLAIAVGLFTGNLKLAGAATAIQGFTSIIGEISENWDAIKQGDWSGVDRATLVIGVIEVLGGIVTALGVFSKIKSSVDTSKATTGLEKVVTTTESINTSTSTLTSKMTSLVKNLALGIVVIAEVAVGAGIIVGAIWGLGALLEQVGIAWQPVIENAGTVAIAMGVGVGLLAAIGVVTALLGNVGTSLIVNLALGIATLALLGVSAGLFIAEIWAIGWGLEQIGIAWQPVLDNGDRIAKSIGIGTALLVGIGVVTALLGVATVASAGLLPLAIGLGTVMLLELGVATLLFVTEILAIGKVLNELGEAWQPVLDNGDTISAGIEKGTELLIAIGVVTAALGVASVASVGLLPLAIGLGTALLVDLGNAVVEFNDSLVQVAESLGDKLHPALRELNGKLPTLSNDMDDFTKFMKHFAQQVVDYSKSSTISGFSATVNSIIGFFSKDPIKSMADDVNKQYKQAINLNDKLSLANPELNTVISLMKKYYTFLEEIERLTGKTNNISLANGMFANMKEVGKNLVIGFVDGIKSKNHELSKGIKSVLGDALSDKVADSYGNDFGKRLGSAMTSGFKNSYFPTLYGNVDVSERGSVSLKLKAYAAGGFPDAGQMFVAREAGPELVGTIGNRNVVVNNDQIVESVSQGVCDANAEQNALLREEISILRKILEKDISTTAYVGTGSLISGLERKNRRDGRTIVPIGV